MKEGSLAQDIQPVAPPNPLQREIPFLGFRHAVLMQSTEIRCSPQYPTLGKSGNMLRCIFTHLYLGEAVIKCIVISSLCFK